MQTLQQWYFLWFSLAVFIVATPLRSSSLLILYVYFFEQWIVLWYSLGFMWHSEALQGLLCNMSDVVFARFMEPSVIVVLGGVLPFGSIFIEMWVVFSAVFTLSFKSDQFRFHWAFVFILKWHVLRDKNGMQHLSKFLYTCRNECKLKVFMHSCQSKPTGPATWFHCFIFAGVDHLVCCLLKYLSSLSSGPTWLITEVPWH